MTEPAPAKRLLTRRPVIAGAMLLVLVLAVAGFFFGWFGGDAPELVKVQLVGFTNSADGKSIFATLVLRTKSDDVGYPLQVPPNRPVGRVPLVDSRFRSVSPSGEVLWTMPQALRLQNSVHYYFDEWDPAASVALPHDGRTGKLEIRYEVAKYSLPAPVRRFLGLFGPTDPESFEERWAVCEQEIQCPRLLPDGTIEPPRVLTEAPR